MRPLKKHEVYLYLMDATNVKMDIKIDIELAMMTGICFIRTP